MSKACIKGKKIEKGRRKWNLLFKNTSTVQEGKKKESEKERLKVYQNIERDSQNRESLLE